jgi:hypothetical protein
MQTELDNIKTKFSAAASGLSELFKVVLKSQNDLYDKGKQDAYLELVAFCHKHIDSEGKIDKVKLQSFLEEKINEMQQRSKEIK